MKSRDRSADLGRISTRNPCCYVRFWHKADIPVYVDLRQLLGVKRTSNSIPKIEKISFVVM